jgi:WD40 repeat protein
MLETGLSEPGSGWRAGTGSKIPAETSAGLGRKGGYELLDEIARGGMGIVYRARDLALNRVVALKLMLAGQFATESDVKRFQTEAEAAARLDHPNIVPIYEFGELEGRPFLSMRLVEGTNLAKKLRGKPLDATPTAQLMSILARAVHYAHQRGILHRDLKPANILLDSAGQPYVTDFGLAKCLDSADGLTLSGATLGSPNYMPPEQAAGHAEQLTTAADTYSLGAIMYELLTGRPPFLAGTPLQTLRKVMEEAPATPRLVSKFVDRDLETICLKCMERQPERRYGSAEALADELERWLRHEPIQARPAGGVERLAKWMRRNPKVATLAILLNLVFAAALGLGVFLSLRIAAAKKEAEKANTRLARNVRSFEWQKIDELIGTGKRSDALAYLSSFLRQNPNDQLAAKRTISMMSSRTFGLPAAVPLRHGAQVNSLALSADDRRLLTGADDGKVRLWDLQSGGVLSILNHPVKVIQAEFLAGEKEVLTTCQDGVSRLWELNEAKILFQFPKAPPGVWISLMSRDRRHVALREDNSMQLWELPKCRQIGELLRVPQNVKWAAFSPDDHLLAASCVDGTIGIWNTENAQPIIPPLKVPGEVTRLEFSPDARLLAASWGPTITLWDAQRWTKVAELKDDPEGHNGQVLAIQFSPDGRRLASTCYDKPVKIWDLDSGRLLGKPIQAERPFPFCCFSPDGRRLATRAQTGVARVWDAFTGLALSEPFEHEGPITDLRFTSNGRHIVTASQDGTAQLWDISPGTPQSFEARTSDEFPSACFSSNGRLVVRGSGHVAEAFDLQTGQSVGKQMAHEELIYRMKISPDGKKLATAGWDGVGRIWNLETGEPLTPPLRQHSRLYDISFSPDGLLVATCSADFTARLWSAQTGQPIGPELLHQEQVMQVSFRPDSRALLTASVDGTARLWSADDGRPLWPEPLRHKGIVWTAEFSPDGQRIVTASADRSALVWDAQTLRPLTRPMVHERSVSGAVFSPDGKWVLTHSEDGTARVWAADTGEPVSDPMRHKAKITEATFSPDMRWVLTGSADGTARLWDARTGYPVSEPLMHLGPVTCVQFSPDGTRCLSIASRDALRVWPVVEVPVPAPPWFAEFVEAVAGKRLNAQGAIEAVRREALQPFREKLASARQSDFYSHWARWFLLERQKDALPPFAPSP